jgi:hypothetical protein
MREKENISSKSAQRFCVGQKADANQICCAFEHSKLWNEHEHDDRKSRLVVGSLNSGLAIVCVSFSGIGRW